MSKDTKDIELTEKLMEMAGAAKAFGMVGSVVNAARYGLIKQIQATKSYKYLGEGYDWHTFCKKYLGADHKTINRELEYLEQFGEPFLRVAERLGLTRRDLNALGSGLPEDAKAEFKKGVITIGDVRIKETEIDEHLDELKDAITAFTKQAEETRAELKAQQRLAEVFRKNNEKLHKRLDTLEKKEEEKSLTSDEAEFIDKMAKLRTGFDGYMLKVDPLRMDELQEEACTERMKAAYLETLGYMRHQILAAYENATLRYGSAVTAPEKRWSPGMGAALKDKKE